MRTAAHSGLFTFFVIALSAMLVCACGKETEGNVSNPDGNRGQSGTEVVDGKVSFYIEIDPSSPHASVGVNPGAQKVIVSGKEYQVRKDQDGRSYVTVDASASGSCNAVLIDSASRLYYGKSPSANVKVPCSQFYRTSVSSLKGYPMYATCTGETGGTMIFKDAFALMDLCLKGDALIESVKISSPDGVLLGGTADYMQETGCFSASKGLPFAVLNCTDYGNCAPLSASGTHFYIMVIPGTYPKGLDITVCDASDRVMRFNEMPGELKGNQVFSISRDYVPDEGVAFFEGFDNMVWGGDYVGGESTTAYSTSATAMGIADGKTLTGYENAFTEVSYNMPGTGYIQSNTWDQVNGMTVKTSHQLSDSYIASRGLTDYKYCFRTQEYQGCVAIGAAAGTRGILQTPLFKGIEGIQKVMLSFDFCVIDGFNDLLLAQIYNAGYISEVRIDGKKLELNDEQLNYRTVISKLIAPAASVIIPASAGAKKKWQHCEMTVDRATSGTNFYIASNEATNGRHGIFIDNIEVRQLGEMERGDLRVLYWNIQNGMWADQANGYRNFIAWVKKYDPDVCVWCEAESIYLDNTSTSSGSSKYLPDAWNVLAGKYGHSHVACGGNRDNFPQEITSRYPITTLARITDGDISSKPVAHGAGLHRITVKGRTINIVTMHTWPQGYGYGVAAADQEKSKAAHEGDYYREYEMKCVLDRTILSSKYSSATDWLLIGDLNSRSRLDAWYYSYAADDPIYLCQDQILNRTDLVDIIHYTYPNDFMSSTSGSSRIDQIYASPSVFKCVKNAMILTDDWNIPVVSQYVSTFKDPSDHRPVLVDFSF